MSRDGRPARSRRDELRFATLLVLGGLAALFAVLNLDEVEVNWIISTWNTPLVFVIAVCLLIGAGLGWAIRGRRAR